MKVGMSSSYFSSVCAFHMYAKYGVIFVLHMTFTSCKFIPPKHAQIRFTTLKCAVGKLFGLLPRDKAKTANVVK